MQYLAVTSRLTCNALATYASALQLITHQSCLAVDRNLIYVLRHKVCIHCHPTQPCPSFCTACCQDLVIPSLKPPEHYKYSPLMGHPPMQRDILLYFKVSATVQGFLSRAELRYCVPVMASDAYHMRSRGGTSVSCVVTRSWASVWDPDQTVPMQSCLYSCASQVSFCDSAHAHSQCQNQFRLPLDGWLLLLMYQYQHLAV